MGGAGGLSTEMKRAAQEDATVSALVLDLAMILASALLFGSSEVRKTNNLSLVYHF